MLKTLKTLVEARFSEAEDGIEAREGPRLLAQHLRRVEEELRQARLRLAGLMAEAKAEDRQIAAQGAELARRRGELAAVADATLADQVADRIVTLEDLKADSLAARQALDQRISALRDLIHQAEARSAKLAGELRTIRARKASRVTETRLTTGSASALEEAERLVARLTASDLRAEDELTALRHITRSSASDLDHQLAQSGVDQRAARKKALIEAARGDAK